MAQMDDKELLPPSTWTPKPQQRYIFLVLAAGVHRLIGRFRSADGQTLQLSSVALLREYAFF